MFFAGSLSLFVIKCLCLLHLVSPEVSVPEPWCYPIKAAIKKCFLTIFNSLHRNPYQKKHDFLIKAHEIKIIVEQINCTCCVFIVLI